MHLPLDDHRVDDVAEVVHRNESIDMHLAGVGVDFHFADVRAGRVGEVGRVVEGVFIQPRFQLVERVVVRHVGRERDFAEGLGAVRAGHAEDAVLELDVLRRGFQQMRRDLLGLGLDFVERLHDGRAAHGNRARTIRAHAEGDAAGIAVHDLDVLDRHAQAIGHDLRKGRFMALAVAVRAGEYRDGARRVHADFAGFKQASPCPQRPSDVRWRKPARLDVAGIAHAAQPALGA